MLQTTSSCYWLFFKRAIKIHFVGVDFSKSTTKFKEIVKIKDIERSICATQKKLKGKEKMDKNYNKM